MGRGRVTTTSSDGDSVYVDAGRVHASFNVGSETAHLRVVIGPAIGPGSGYEFEDVSGQDPWASLRSRAGRLICWPYPASANPEARTRHVR